MGIVGLKSASLSSGLTPCYIRKYPEGVAVCVRLLIAYLSVSVTVSIYSQTKPDVEDYPNSCISYFFHL